MSQTQPEVSVSNPRPIRFVHPILEPFHIQGRIVGPAKLTNTPRIDSLVRAGNLYLSKDDVIALALENNLDIAVQRYAVPLADEGLRRAESGQALRDLSLPIAAGPQSVSLSGVSVNSVGLAGGGSGVSSGGGLVIATGVSPVSMDPFLYASANYSHNTTPLSNLQAQFVPFFLQGVRSYTLQYGQQWATGTSANLTFGSTRYAVNSPGYPLNPYTQGFLDLTISQPLLQGFGFGVNKRFIRMAKNNIKVSDLQFKLQVITSISAILNVYWDLVSFDEDLRIKQQALATAQQLYEDNQKQAELGTLPQIEVTRAEAQVSQAKEDLLISQTTAAQQEIVLKNALTRNGANSGWLDDVHIITLDKVVVPPSEDLKPVNDLVAEALTGRPEIEQAKINLESSKISTAGTRNNLLPSLNAFVDLTNNALAGPQSTLPKSAPATPALIGGYGTLLGQIFGHDYPNYAAGISLTIPFRNRVAQADYVLDELDLRRRELQYQQAAAQVRVDVRNAVIGLQQARARYETAVATRKLDEQTLEAEKMRFKYGESTIANVVAAERTLASDQSAEVQAMANYTHAHIAFDQSIGVTLDVNHVSLEEARKGQVARQSTIPDNAPAPRN
ncbi:MAG TPA: TolC family protein [Bryobacteraceae bacterium]|nr:TolC family protein [Bryobacteraceae bacterium]